MIDFNFSDHEKRVLSNVGQGAYGRELTELMGKLRTRVCSLEDLDDTADNNAEVKARLLFKKFADELIEHLKIDVRRGHSAQERDTYE